MPDGLLGLVDITGCGDIRLGAGSEKSVDVAGPAMVLTVPPIRKSFGWRPAERIPTTFPCKSPIFTYSE